MELEFEYLVDLCFTIFDKFLENLVMKNIVASAILIVLLSGCATQEFVINGGAARGEVEEMNMFFLAGLSQSETLDAAAVCGGAANVVSVRTSQEPVDILISYLTGALVYPRTATIACR